MCDSPIQISTAVFCADDETSCAIHMCGSCFRVLFCVEYLVVARHDCINQANACRKIDAKYIKKRIFYKHFVTNSRGHCRLTLRGNWSVFINQPLIFVVCCNNSFSGLLCRQHYFHTGTGCPAGTYSLGMTTECTDCPAGYICPSIDTLADQVACDPGTYSTGRQTTCTACPAGK